MSCAKRCLSFLICVLFACAAIAGGALYFAGRWLLQNDAPAKADVILVLGGDPTRAFEGAELYKSGFAPVVFISAPIREASAVLLDNAGIAWPREESITRQVLQARGVPEHAIQLLGRDMRSTAMEADAARGRLAGKALLVVTSPYHTRRTAIIFHSALPQADIRVVSNRYESFPEAWWKDQAAARNVLLEIAKLGYYLVGGRF